jgi:hypothetical protein
MHVYAVVQLWGARAKHVASMRLSSYTLPRVLRIFLMVLHSTAALGLYDGQGKQCLPS